MFLVSVTRLSAIALIRDSAHPLKSRVPNHSSLTTYIILLWCMADIRTLVERAIAADRRLEEEDLESLIRKLQYRERKSLLDYAEKLRTDGPPKTASLKDKIVFAVNALENDIEDIAEKAKKEEDSDDDPLGLGALGIDDVLGDFDLDVNLGLTDDDDEDGLSDLDDEKKRVDGYDSSDVDGEGRRRRAAERMAKKNPEKYKKKLKRIMKKSRKRIPQEYLEKAFYAAKLASKANSRSAAEEVILRKGMVLNIEGTALRMWVKVAMRMLNTMRKYG